MVAGGDEHQDHHSSALFARFGPRGLFSVSKAEDRAGGHLSDAGELQGDLGWGGKNHHQR
jgi:hypothetical protein